MLKKGSYRSEPVYCWNRFIAFYNELKRTGAQWVFRGQKKSERPLTTTLERAIVSSRGVSKGFPREDDPEYERKLREYREALKTTSRRPSVYKLELGLLREFKRKCHHYTMEIPKDDNIMEWLALMRHYGAPARLFDWTYSFFVALYFALEKAEGECAVWALNTDWMKERWVWRGERSRIIKEIWCWFKSDETVKKLITFKNVFAREEYLPMVLAVNPYRLNERLVIQQGVFLCPLDVSKPFEDNLEALCSSDSDFEDNLIKFEINIDLETRKEFLQHLHRMNINRATLFPGLDGFAQSLETLLLTFPEILQPDPGFMPGDP